jgi:hypothetical protein
MHAATCIVNQLCGTADCFDGFFEVAMLLLWDGFVYTLNIKYANVNLQVWEHMCFAVLRNG